tara:strand:+ start:2373 stop:2936 length:564 start_codon:yes stop_codon:yes gene_type:complete
MRTTSSAVQAEISAAANTPVHLVEVTLGATVYRITDAYIALTWGGNEYSQAGHFLGFSDIEESATLQVSKLTVSLSAIDKTFVSLLLSQDYLDRPIKIYKGFLDAAGALIVDPLLVFEGRIDSPIIQEDPDAGTATIAVSASNSWGDFLRRIGRFTNHEGQQVHFPGDLGLQFASEIVKDVVWGKTG